MSVAQWFSDLFKAGRMGCASETMTHRLKRTMPWIKRQQVAPVKRRETARREGGKFHWIPKSKPGSYQRFPPVSRMDVSNALKKVHNIEMNRKRRVKCRKTGNDSPLSVRDALASRRTNYRHLYAKR